MARKILDTSVLITYWNRRRGRARGRCSEADAIEWGQDLVRMLHIRAIVTPVKLEFVCGARSKDELRLYEAFLGAFEVLDQGRILGEDWQTAERFARRVPRNGKPRQLGDCLIAAIANRLRLDVLPYDDHFPK